MRIRLNEKATKQDIDFCNKNGQNLVFVKIYDYKTGATAKLSDDYKNQLIYIRELLEKQQSAYAICLYAI